MKNTKDLQGICKHCEVAFMYSKYDSKGLFCSHEHFTLYRQAPERSIKNFTCRNCGVRQRGSRYGQIYCNQKCQMYYEYSQGLRDGKAITVKAHETIRQNGQPKKKGQPMPWLHNPEVRAKSSATRTGRPVPKLQGANHGNWTGGADKSYWKTPEYQAWRKAVMRRDKFTCIKCGDSRGGNLEADHIKPRYLFPELMLDVSNGRTLCKPCHRLTPTWGKVVTLLSREAFA